ncbi:BA75_03919T0 [Komagataella pastoris]|uniref:Inositol-pentakisphosphate 2-kinase n=1 Tax=Komagataella pastoris TaxID=4922 RepID=A0A1B2JFQ2_PICPA|nr:BA75_03919T0 [Komagataella pastoris]
MNNPEHWTFLNKGKANAIFKYIGDDMNYKGKVIRLRLANQLVLSKEIFEFVNTFRPRLHHLIAMELIPISSDFLRALAQESGIAIKEDTHGIIMPLIELPEQRKKVSKHISLYTDSINNHLTVEIKPKWLYSIPQNTTLCRNCALNFYRDEELLCSLDLLNPNLITDWVDRLGLNEQHSESLTHFLLSSDLFHILFDLQNFKDIHETIGKLNSENEVPEELVRSMALKDVTVYISLAEDDTKVTIIDLDKKHPSKFRHWKKQEELLGDLYSQDSILKKQCYRHPPV